MTATLPITRVPQVSEHELRFLNFYRASELHGGLILGQVARRTRDGVLSGELLKHSAEEVEHARVWTRRILAVGGRVHPVRDTYQTRYAAIIGRPVGVLHVLALTQIFERRVYRHFTEHLRRAGNAPRRARRAAPDARGRERPPQLGEALAR